MEIVELEIDKIKEYEKNPRKNDDAVDAVAKSIEKYGFRNPLIIDENNIVWCGNTRLKASKKLGLDEVPCIIVNDLTEQQMTELALLDNKTNEIAEWDFNMLEGILQNVDLGEFDLDWGFINNGVEEQEEDENPYTMKVDIPQYEIKGICPAINELINTEKTKELEKEIENANITKEQKEFLKMAAKRHQVFDYAKIAEYYAHQNKEMQTLMEKSALVIIDFGDAIKNGYVEVRKEIESIFEEEVDDYDED